MSYIDFFKCNNLQVFLPVDGVDHETLGDAAQLFNRVIVNINSTDQSNLYDQIRAWSYDEFIEVMVKNGMSDMASKQNFGAFKCIALQHQVELNWHAVTRYFYTNAFTVDPGQASQDALKEMQEFYQPENIEDILEKGVMLYKGYKLVEEDSYNTYRSIRDKLIAIDHPASELIGLNDNDSNVGDSVMYVEVMKCLVGIEDHINLTDILSD